MKLWKVTAEVEMFIASESEPKNNFGLEHDVAEAARDGCDITSVSQVTDIIDVPKEWRDSLPYGDRQNPELTCEEILLGTLAEREATEEACLEAIRQAPMPNQIPLFAEGK